MPWARGSSKRLRIAAAALWMVGCWGCGASEPYPDSIPPSSLYAPLAEQTGRLIEHEMRQKALPGLSIVIVDDQAIVWARGFGFADPEQKVPASANTVYRVGSVSKLFTDIAVMQLVASGEIDLDAPVTRYLPTFRPENPFAKPITLRQLMSHRAGLAREPPVGNYFDPTEPSLAETVASLNETELVYEPETRLKYSNAGIAAVGYVLEHMKKAPFAEVLRRHVLEPLGMARTRFAPSPELSRHLAKAYMWTYDGREFEAPRFELGMAPAGSMTSNAVDLGRFMEALFRGGQGPGGRVLEAETLERMYRPQFAEDGAREGMGIGFAVSDLDGRRLLRHGGAIYGFATELAFLPDEKLGVAVVTTVDAANRVVTRIARHVLRSALRLREAKPLPELRLTEPVDPTLARRLAGRYVHDEETAELVERSGRLWLWLGSTRGELRALGDRLIVDDRLDYGLEIEPGDAAITLGDQSFQRRPTPKPAPAPEKWRGLMGEYGWDHDTLYILEKQGRLHALIEWFFLYPLEEIAPDVYAFPPYGLYDGEKLIFHRDGTGKATAVVAANVRFERRAVGTEEGATFRIEPLRPVEELRKSARAAEPPPEPEGLREPDLVEVVTLDPSIHLDIRYATTNNFMGARFYKQPRAFLQRPAAEALVAAHRSLRDEGYGLLIHDAYRPWYVTKMFWDATPEVQKIFVADPAHGSRHNRGAAVDVTLYDLTTGKPIRMVGGYDEFSPRSYPAYPGGTSLQRWHRELLRQAMEEQGFEVYEFEWWHFDYKDWDKYPVLNLAFENLTVAGR